MKRKIKWAVLAAAAVFVIVGTAYAAPEVSNVVMTQRSGSRTVDIWYDLAGEAAIVTLGIETNGVALPASAVTRLVGDVSVLIQPGTGRHIVWSAGADWPENLTQDAKAKVIAWVEHAPPPFMVINLTAGASASSYPVLYYPSLDALPHGGITNMIYKSTHLTMQKIPSGGFTMGEGPEAVAVTLTKDFYAGLFQVTQGQWYQVMGTRPSYFIDAESWQYRPVERVAYDDIRGSSEQGGGGWPINNNVYGPSFMGRLRAKTGNIDGFDLPTSAQWEYACRAGTTTYYNDNLGTPANAISNAQMDVLGRYAYNSGDILLSPSTCGPENGTAIVGSYLPNAWGFYDMHGNVWEWCLDWFVQKLPLEGGADPKGPLESEADGRVRRGGNWSSLHETSGVHCRSAAFGRYSSESKVNETGFRLVRTMP